MAKFCIYAITHIASGERYVGSSIDHEARWKAHFGHLNRGTHHCRRLQKAWTKFGPEAFRFEVLAYGSGDRAARHDLELEWIKRGKHFNSMSAHLTLNQFQNTPATRKLISISTRKARGTPEARKRQSRLIKAAWANPNSNMRNRKKPTLPQEVRDSKAAKMRAFHESTEGQALKERRAAKLRAYWADPTSKLRNRRPIPNFH